MTARIFAYIIHKGGMVDDSAAELLTAAKRIDATATPTALVLGGEPEIHAVAQSLRASYAEIWRIADTKLQHPNSELARRACVTVIPPGSIVLIPHNHFGIDLGPGLSVTMNAAFVSDVVAIAGVQESYLHVVRQEFGGIVSTHVRCAINSGIVINVRPGAFKPQEPTNHSGTVIDKSSTVGELTSGRRYIETIVATLGDVDITRESVLVSVGRGIQDKENIQLAEDLAQALGGAVSCSRPVVDAKWLERSRQVGSSGKTVKPKVYLACGISGSFQHLAGLKGNPFIVAINKNPKAPIFQVAHVGIVADLIEFLPLLTSKVLAERKEQYQ